MTQVAITHLPADFFSITFFFFSLCLPFQLTLHAVWGGFGLLSHFLYSMYLTGQALLDSLAITYEDMHLSCM